MEASHSHTDFLFTYKWIYHIILLFFSLSWPVCGCTFYHLKNNQVQLVFIYSSTDTTLQVSTKSLPFLLFFFFVLLFLQYKLKVRVNSNLSFCFCEFAKKRNCGDCCYKSGLSLCATTAVLRGSSSSSVYTVFVCKIIIIVKKV